MAQTKPSTRHESILAAHGFQPMEDYLGVMVLDHPRIPKVKLVASTRVGGRIDLFTQFGSSPLNTPGDPMNICLGVNDHDEVFVGLIIVSVVAHFLNLS